MHQIPTGLVEALPPISIDLQSKSRRVDGGGGDHHHIQHHFTVHMICFLPIIIMTKEKTFIPCITSHDILPYLNLLIDHFNMDHVVICIFSRLYFYLYPRGGE